MVRFLAGCVVALTLCGCSSPPTSTKVKSSAKTTDSPFKIDGKAKSAFVSGYKARVGDISIESWLVTEDKSDDKKYIVELNFKTNSGGALQKGFSPNEAAVSQIRISQFNGGGREIRWFREFKTGERDYTLSFTETKSKIAGKIKAKVYASDRNLKPAQIDYTFDYEYSDK